jgi:hypothetical protein
LRSPYFPPYLSFQTTDSPEPILPDPSTSLPLPHNNNQDGTDGTNNNNNTGGELLQQVLAMGLTYDDLISQGMHPTFLNQLFGRIPSPASQLPSAKEAPPPIPLADTTLVDTPLPPHETTPARSATPQIPTPDVDSFLDALEPAMTSHIPPRKRGPQNGALHHPTKRRAFGLGSPRELVIDVSDDDDDDDDEEDAEPNKESKSGTPTVTPAPPLIRRQFSSKPPERRSLKHQVISFSLLLLTSGGRQSFTEQRIGY